MTSRSMNNLTVNDMPISLKKIHKCEVCGGMDLKPVLNLGMHALCDDLVAVDEDRRCAEYPIEIVFCSGCRTAHQKYQVDKEALFPASYHYRSKNTADVLDGMEQFVNSCSERLSGLRENKVLDIGCNDGSLLSLFKKLGAYTFGIEPTDAYLDAKEAGHAVVNDYLTEESARNFVSKFGKADVLTFTNVFAHIEDLETVLRSINILRHPESALMIENHYLGSVLKHKQFDTFYHEHPRTYSYGSFVKIAKTLGMEIDFVEFPSRYGGNIRVLMLPKSGTGAAKHHLSDTLEAEEARFIDAFSTMASEIEGWLVDKKREIQTAVKTHGPLVAKAFPGRAAIPIKMLGLDHTMVKAAYEKPQSQKIGHWIPGTRIPIVSDDSIITDLAYGAPILNFAWHIDDEIRKYMEHMGFSGQYINII